MNIVVLGPQIEPLTREDVKLYRRIDTAADDALVDAMIAAARQACEHRIQRTLIETTRATILDGFPSAIRLAFPPIQAVESVQYIDRDGVQQTLASSAYVLDPDTIPGYVVPAYNTEWPETRSGQIRSVRVQYTTGYLAGGTDAQKRAAVPASLRMWMQLAIGEMYELREATITGTIATKLAFADALLEEHVVRLAL